MNYTCTIHIHAVYVLYSKWLTCTSIYVLHIGHGDLCYHGGRAGCVNLLKTIQSRIKPKYHVFGHIHEGNTVHVRINLAHTYYILFLLCVLQL